MTNRTSSINTVLICLIIRLAQLVLFQAMVAFCYMRAQACASVRLCVCVHEQNMCQSSSIAVFPSALAHCPQRLDANDAARPLLLLLLLFGHSEQRVVAAALVPFHCRIFQAAVDRCGSGLV